MKKNIAILGGAFNPPHLGHLIMAHEVLEFTPAQEVWLAPVYKHTFNKNLAPVDDRVKMTKLLTNKHIKYCGVETENQMSGETVELMTALSKKHPEYQFSFVIGSDNLKNFKKWGQWQELVSSYVFWVYPRPEYPINLKKHGLSNPKYHFKIMSNPKLTLTNISSTLIRKRIENGLKIDHLLPKKVVDYIRNNKLFR